jgi:DNA-nicking Smr family endonuclease
MRGAPDVEDLHLWAVVTATVRPLRPPQPSLPLDGGEAVRVGESGGAPKPTKRPPIVTHPHPVLRTSLPMKGREPAPADVEANLRHRLARGREALAARIDLHGLTHDAARAALTRFIERSVAEGWRAVLVITGKGVGGDGVLRRRVPEWLAAPPIRPHVAGVSEAHRRHGGEGALYVALKRKR